MRIKTGPRHVHAMQVFGRYLSLTSRVCGACSMRRGTLSNAVFAGMPKEKRLQMLGHEDAHVVEQARTTNQASGVSTMTLAAVMLLPAGFFWYLRSRGGQELPMPRSLKAAGVEVSPALRIRTTADKGTGLVLSAPVCANTVLIRVPQRAVLTGSMAQRVLGTTLSGRAALCTLLAEGRRSAEKGDDLLGLKEYLLALPARFPTLPLSFSENEAEAQLRGTVLVPALSGLWASLETERQDVMETLGNQLEAIWSQNRWLWACAAVMTRAGPGLLLEHAGESNADAASDAFIAIVPLIDFANCSADPTATCRLAEDGAVELVVTRDLSKGTEVTISYGSQSQEQQMYTFGFVLEESPLEIVSPLSMALPTETDDQAVGSQKSHEMRSALLKLLYLERNDGLSKTGGTEVETNLPPFARLRAGNGPEPDLTELIAVSNLLEMEDAKLREVLSHVKAHGVLPRTLHEEASVAALRRLLELLLVWHGELSQPALPGKHFKAAQTYRERCAYLVEAALDKVRAQEEMAAAIAGGRL